MRYLAHLIILLSLAGCARAVRQALILYEELTTFLGPDQVTTRFDRAFIESYRDRILIEATFTVDAVNSMVNPPSFDGDLHLAGRAPEIGLRLVAEIKNASTRKDALALVREAERTRNPVIMTGVWRYWPEHAIGLPHRQGEPMKRLSNANPDHLFEVHPVLRLEELDLRETLAVVEGYRPGSAPRTIALYEKAVATVRADRDRVFIETPAGLVNDLHFWLEPVQAAVERPDGFLQTARIRDREGNLLADSVRTIFIRDTPPARVLRADPGTATLHVWGLPRISFAGLAELLDELGPTGTRTIKLPYELIIVGIYPPES